MRIESRSLVHEPMIEQGYEWENLQLVFTGGHYEWLRRRPNSSADAEYETWLIYAISKDPFISQSISGGKAGVCQSQCKWVCTYLMHDSESLVALLIFSVSSLLLDLFLRRKEGVQSCAISVQFNQLGFVKSLFRCNLFLLTIPLTL